MNRAERYIRSRATIDPEAAAIVRLWDGTRKPKPEHIGGPRCAGKSREERRKDKVKVRREVREACVGRAHGLCEACRQWHGSRLELDHFWGRAREESVESCWMLCHDCHHEKTENDPTRHSWLLRFSLHCRVEGYDEQIQKCSNAIALEEAQHPEAQAEARKATR